MIKISLKLIFSLLFIVSFFNSCQDECYYYQEVTEYHEILENLDTVKNSFSVVNDFAIKKPGNIYTYNQYLFVEEKNLGIHILDNSNPASPIPLKFIKLKGNSDFAVANNILLADNGTDLLSINISDLANIKIDKRTENINPDVLRPNNKVVTGYNEVKVKNKISCQNNNRFMQSSASPTMAGSSNPVSAGKGGSMAKFAVLGQYLYIANASVLHPIEISNPSNPIIKPTVSFVTNNVETIFPYKNYLYFGTGNGVLIYDCSGSPQVPAYKTMLSHALGCDPVVVSDDYCFSTVRNNTACRNGNTVNSLFIYNISNVNAPIYEAFKSLESPYGLGVKGNLVFICQADNGLTVYQWDPLSKAITLKHKYPDIHATDVIINTNTLIVTAENGLFQFDCTDPDNIQYLSTLSAF